MGSSSRACTHAQMLKAHSLTAHVHTNSRSCAVQVALRTLQPCIILSLPQFCRHSLDGKARQWAGELAGRAEYTDLHPCAKQFLALPFMHEETMAGQQVWMVLARI